MREYSSETCLQFETSDTERSHQGNQINNGVKRRDRLPGKRLFVLVIRQ